ncbi:MAG: ABC transporter ATP-binding protein/permease [Erysipelotrichaceae bacterium]|jgi:ATP-binding cassette subfamily B protein|nr:ABC transporter ATP-binding protein/permease [Erysipelotrichaceae bacterium]
MAKAATMKAKNPKRALKMIVSDLKHQKWIFLIIVIVLALGAVLGVLLPRFLQLTLNNLINFDIMIEPSSTSLPDYILIITTDREIIVNWSYILIRFGIISGIYITSAFLSWLADFLIVRIVSVYAYQLRNEMQMKVNRLPLKYFDGTTYGEILSRCTNDVEVIIQNFNGILTQTVTGIATIISVTIMMFVSSWQLTLVALAQLPFLLLLVAIVAKYSQKQFVKYRTKLGNLSSLAEETYSGHTVVKLFNMENDFETQFETINADLTRSDRWSQWLSSLIFPGMRFIQNVGFVGICLVAGLISQDNPVASVALMTVFVLYLNIFQTPFQQMGQISSSFQMTVAATERIYELLMEPEETKDLPTAIYDNENIQGKISIKHAFFSYSDDVKLIEDMNLEVNVGDLVAIVGPTGAGKTTIVNLLMRFYDVNAGQILLDDVDVKDYSRNSLRDVFGMVLQDTWLFKGTIRENILFGQEGATETEMIEASKKANADHFIKTLPNGYDFMLNEDGTNLSQGQRQLITIARAIISRPKILILDEATSSVDTRTEFMIQEAMREMMVGKTSFMIAHRLSTIKNAKTILVMNHGSIIEKGSHKELMAKRGFYYELYTSQYLNTNHETIDEETSS